MRDLAGPGIGDDQIALAGPLLDIAGSVDDLRNDAEEGPCRRAGLELDRSGQRRDKNAASLGLPPRVDDRAAALADDPVIPLPSFGIDRLADRAEQAQRRAACLLHRLLARAHQRADRGRSGIEDVDLMLVDDFPEAAHRRIVRDAFEHQGRRAVGERAVDDVAVARDPTDVGGAPVDVALVIVEDILVGHRGKDEISAGGVDDALGRAGRAGGVEDEQRILGVHRLGRAMRGHRLFGFVQPDVAPVSPADGASRAPDDDYCLDAAGLLGGGIGVGLQRHLAPAAQAFIRGDDDFRLGARDAACERLGREAAEHDGMNRPDPRAGEHRIRRLRESSAGRS